MTIFYGVSIFTQQTCFEAQIFTHFFFFFYTRDKIVLFNIVFIVAVIIDFHSAERTGTSLNGEVFNGSNIFCRQFVFARNSVPSFIWKIHCPVNNSREKGQLPTYTDLKTKSNGVGSRSTEFFRSSWIEIGHSITWREKKLQNYMGRG